eukprot:4648246-Amphidinium_carterae.1
MNNIEPLTGTGRNLKASKIGYLYRSSLLSHQVLACKVTLLRFALDRAVVHPSLPDWLGYLQDVAFHVAYHSTGYWYFSSRQNQCESIGSTRLAVENEAAAA